VEGENGKLKFPFCVRFDPESDILRFAWLNLASLEVSDQFVLVNQHLSQPINLAIQRTRPC